MKTRSATKHLTLEVVALALILSAGSAWGTIYFADNFESGLGQWQPGSGGVITTDPDPMHGHVLTFNRLMSGGDIWSQITVPAGAYLSFDYMGVGAYIGTAGDWLAGSQGYPGLEQALTYDGTWRHYEVQVRSGGRIMAEDGLGTPGQQFFDNIVVADYPNASFPAPSIVSQPTNVTNTAGATITFSISATGVAPLSYQWQFDGTNLLDEGNITGSTSNSLIVINVSALNTGSYTVIVSNAYGSVISAAAALTVLTCIPPSFSLVSWWPGDGNANDIFGTNNGTLNGAAFAPGIVGQAFSFDGVAGYVRIPVQPELLLDHFSIAAWVKPNAPVDDPSGEEVLFAQDDGRPQLVVRTGASGMKVAIQFRASTIYPDCVSSNEIPIGSFSHVAGTWDGLTLRVFLNGLLDNEVVSNDAPTNTSRDFFIGGINDPPVYVGQFFNGLIDEPALFQSAISPDEIAAIYAAGSAGMCKPQCAPPPSGLVSWWPGDGNANDIVGGNNGTLQNGAAFAPGIVQQAFSFDGVDDYIVAPDSPSFNLGATNSFTVAFWVNNSISSRRMALLEKVAVDAPYQGFYIDLNADSVTNQLRFVLDGGVPAVFVSVTDSRISDGQWHLVAGVLDRSSDIALLYFDGTSAASGTTTGIGSLQNANSLYAGNRYGLDIPFKGLIDELNFFNRALSSDEIAALFAAGSAGMCKPVCVQPPPGLVSWWPGEGNANDIFGTNNGTLNGAAFAPGIVGQAFSFDGVDDYIQVIDAPALRFSNAFAVSAWVQINQPPSPGDKPILHKDPQVSGDRSYGFHMDPDGGIELDVFGTAGTDSSFAGRKSDISLPLGEWHHVAGVYNGAGPSLDVYIDGQPHNGTLLPISGFIPANIHQNSHPVFIGAYVNGIHPFPAYFNGSIDEVALFNRALGSNEIAAIYTAGSAGMCKPQCAPPPGGLVSWWPGDGNANDIIGTNIGTLQDGASFAPGFVGQGFGFDGTNAYVQFPPVSQGLAQGTVEFWFYLNTWNWSTAGVGLFFWSGTAYLPDSGSFDFMDLGTYGGTGELMFGLFSSAWAWAYSGVIPLTNTWYHVAGTWGPNGIQIYVNGVLKGTNPYSGAAPSFSYNLMGRSSWPGTTVNGTIDEVAIFNRALTSEEIATIYAAGSAGMCKPSDLSISLVAAATLVPIGSNLTFSIIVSNRGPLNTSSAVAIDSLPTSLGLISVTPSQGGCTTVGGTVTCRLGTLTNGAAATITIVVTATATGTVTNSASVTANEPDLNLTNNATSVQVTVTPSDQNVLFINVHGGNYDGDGANFYQTLTMTGARATFVNLDANGKAATLIQTNHYDQIWIFDLSAGADDYPADWQAIGDWFNARTNLAIVCDGRTISSYWSGRWQSEGARLTQNYYENLKGAGGGLMLGTDDDNYVTGINSVNDRIGITRFHGNFSLSFIPIDVTSPLMSFPNNLGNQLYDDSSPSQTPFGLQPNGRILYSVAWHSGNTNTPGISSTIRGGVGFRLQIVSPANGSQFNEEAVVSLQVQQTGGTPPFTYTWSSDREGSLGAGGLLQISTLSPGIHRITVLGTDNAGGADTASIQVTILAIAPAVTLALQTASDSGFSNSDNITSNTTPRFDVTINKRGRIEFDFTGDGVPDEVRTNLVAGTHVFTSPILGDAIHTATARFVPLFGSAVQASTSITIDTRGPRVVGVRSCADFGSCVNLPLEHLDVTFDSAIDSATLTAADLTLSGPGGPVGVTGLSAVSSNVFRISFPVQRANGEYLFRLGPNVADIAGNPMDQNANGTNGESPEDVFTAQFNISLSDLLVAQLSGPSNALPGQPIQVSWTLANQGTAIALGPWGNTLYLAADSSGAGSQQVAVLATTNEIAPGGSLTQTATVIVPSGISGSRFLRLFADSGDQVPETNETNNDFTDAEPIEILAPDLIVQSVSAPPNGQFGQPVPVAWTVRNAGNAAANVNWNDRASLSQSSNSLSNVANFGMLSAADIIPLAPGATYSRTQNVMLSLSTSAAPGTYFVLVQADVNNALFESNETNNLQSSGPISLTLPPLPDLEVASLVAPFSSQAGQPLELVWTVTNLGSASATGVWSETVSTSNALRGVEAVALFTFTNALNGGDFIVRTQSVVLPATGQAGEVWFVVEVDSQHEVFEANESNNVAVATNVTTVPLQLRLQVPVTQIREDALDPVIHVTVARNGDLTEPLMVTLTNGDPLRLTVPTNVAIAAGSPAALFDIRVLRDGIVDGPQKVGIAASADGYLGDLVQITVLDADLPRLSLTLATNVVIEGLSVAAMVTRDLVTSNALTVTLQSSSPGQVSLPPTVVIPASSNAAAFVVLAVDDALLEPPTTYNLTASAAGFQGDAVSVTVLDNDVPQVTVSLASHTVSEGAGPQATSATITRDVVTSRAVTLEVFSSDPTAALVPTHVTIPAYQASVSFPVAAVDDQVVDGPQTTVIGAFVLATGSDTRIAEATPDTLTVTDDDGPALFLVVAQKVVKEGLNPATTGALSRNTPATNDLIVILLSSNTNAATLPPSVTIPTGSPSVTFNIASVADNTNAGNRLVVLNASAPGFTAAADTLLVTDTDLPDLVVSSLTVPASAETDGYTNVTYRVSNQGFTTASSSFLTRVFLSQDPVVGNDTLIGEYRFPGQLAVGQYFEQSLQVRMPQSVGNYWVIVTTDTEQIVPEVLEDNNTAISRVPIAVGASYSAVVSAGLHSALAGTPVPMHGQATNSLGAPVGSKLVNIHILVRGTERVISALTDDSGNFSVAWQPLAGEAGVYQIFATHPGVSQAPVQDTFSLLGVRANPASTSLTMVEASSVAGAVRLENLSDQPLTGLSAQIVSKPADLGVAVNLGSNALPALSTVTLGYAFAANSANAYGTVQIRVTSTEGATVDIYFGVSVQPLRPQLLATPGELFAGMVRGGQAMVAFDVANVGGIPSGPITISLPGIPWMQLASTNPITSLAPGETNHVTLQLTPAPDLPLGPYTGNLALNAAQAGLSVPFNFRALSEAKGDLMITTVDEYTYYAEGSPPLANANVLVQDSVTHTNVATGVTDTHGHSFRSTILLSAGQTNEVQAFLSRQTVQYIWTVQPVEIEDRYDITVQTVFETYVPLPVVTIEPAFFDLSTVSGDATQIDFTISNHGLIAANDLRFDFAGNPLWEVKPLLTDLGVLPAQSSLSIPVTARRLQTEAGSAAAPKANRELAAASAATGDPCIVLGEACWTLVCGPRTNQYCLEVPMSNADPACQPKPSSGNPPPPPPTDGGGRGTRGGPVSGSGSGTGNTYVTEPNFAPPSTCDCFVPLCLSWSESVKLDALAKKLAAADAKLLPAFTVSDPSITISGAGRFCTCCKDGKTGFQIDTMGGANVSMTLIGGPNFAGSFSIDNVGGWSDVHASASGLLGVEIKMSGSTQLQLKKECLGDWQFCAQGTLNVEPFAGTKINASISATRGGIPFSGQVNGTLGIQGSMTTTARGCSGGQFTISAAGQLTSVAQLTGTLKAADGTVAGFSWSQNVVIAQAGQPPPPAPGATRLKAASNGDLNTEIILDSFPTDELLMSESEVVSLFGTTNRAPAGICARVRMQLDQQAVVSRDAFKATLEILNNTDTPLQNVDVEVLVRDSLSQDASALFGIRAPALVNLVAVDGTGTVNGGVASQASWTIIPTSEAAPASPTQYFVSGTLHYLHDGLDITVPLASVPITVYPNPRLFVKYFHQRDVFSDDPFTDIVEPSIPFSLAVMVENKGQGEARNFHITSAQPQIVDNEKGLLVDFQIVATEVAGQNLTPSLTVNFGNIEPGQIAIGRWLLTSSLQGLFTDYTATFQHLDALGNQKLSLIEDLSIHEMIHLVQAGGRFEDGKPDFLVNDNSDSRALPDTLYLSDGSTNPVQVVEQSSVGSPPSAANPQAALTAPMPGGWAYLRVPEPSDGHLRLTGVRRSDGLDMAFGTNVWTTDRTFIGMGRPPVRENILHLLDYNSTGSYTLYYAAPPAQDTNAPASAVGLLPANSYQQIPLSWSGVDEATGSGLAFFDIYVSIDGGPFQLWLSHTTLHGAIYAGTLGSHYAFYSVATDNSGNREQPPPVPDADTTVNLTNRAPVIVLPETITVNEGETVTITNSTSDPDLPANILTFSLEPGAPAGAVINPNTGVITWPTGEANGPSTNVITVRVKDNGVPSLSATGTVTVIVNEVNSPPSIAALGNYKINEGQLLAVTNFATDSDLPAQHLTFSLGPGAPEGATIDPTSGLFTWRPADFQGGMTNRISIIVTDDGPGSLSATQTFAVIVRNTRSDFVLSVGTTNIFVGDSNSVPVLLASGADLASISFTLEAAESRLTGLALRELASEVASAELTPVGPGRASMFFRAKPSEALQGSIELAQLNFFAISNAHSAIVPIQISDLIGTRGNGAVLGNGRGVGSRIFVIGAEPILDAEISSNAMRSIMLYGHPNRRYSIEFATSLTSTVAWKAFQEVDLETPSTLITNLADAVTMIFYRAREVGVMPLFVQRSGNSVLIEWSSECADCILEEASDIRATTIWSPSSAVRQLTGTRYRVTVPVNNAGRFYRLRKP